MQKIEKQVLVLYLQIFCTLPWIPSCYNSIHYHLIFNMKQTKVFADFWVHGWRILCRHVEREIGMWMLQTLLSFFCLFVWRISNKLGCLSDCLFAYSSRFLFVNYFSPMDSLYFDLLVYFQLPTYIAKCTKYSFCNEVWRKKCFFLFVYW